MEIIFAYTFELLAFAVLSFIIVLRHNWLEKSLKNLKRSHADAPMNWSVDPVPRRDTN